MRIALTLLAVFLLIHTGTCTAAEEMGRRARAQAGYEGCSSGAWGSVCTTDNGDGTSTVRTKTPYYSGSTTYPNGATTFTQGTNEQKSPGTSNRDDHESTSNIGETSKHHRSLKAPYEGCSSGFWGSVCTTDNKDGTSTTCTKTRWYNGCSTYPNGSKYSGYYGGK